MRTISDRASNLTLIDYKGDDSIVNDHMSELGFSAKRIGEFNSDLLFTRRRCRL